MIKMPRPDNPGTDWYADGYVTGKQGIMQNLQQVKLSNGDTISALPLGRQPLKMIKEEPGLSTTKEAPAVCTGASVYIYTYISLSLSLSVCMYVCS